MSRFVRGETTRIDLSAGDWLLVKQRLTNGETREQLRRSYTHVNGTHYYDPIESGMALVVAYLVDWSLTNDEGKPVVIREKPRNEVVAALDALSSEDFGEIKRAIETHERAMETDRQEKKLLSGGNGSGVISSSLVSGVGATSG